MLCTRTVYALFIVRMKSFYSLILGRIKRFHEILHNEILIFCVFIGYRLLYLLGYRFPVFVEWCSVVRSNWKL